MKIKEQERFLALLEEKSSAVMFANIKRIFFHGQEKIWLPKLKAEFKKPAKENHYTAVRGVGTKTLSLMRETLQDLGKGKPFSKKTQYPPISKYPWH